MLRSDSQQLITEGTSSDTGTRKKTFPSLYESVHSSSDKEKKRSAVTEKSKTLRYDETQKKTESKVEEEQQVLKSYINIANIYISHRYKLMVLIDYCALLVKGMTFNKIIK